MSLRKRVGALAAVAAFAVIPTACGSSKHQAQANQLANSAQTKQAEQYARKVAEGCINRGGGLKAIFHCAIPPHHGAAFLRCVLKGVPKTLSDKAAIEADLVKCGERYR